VVHSSIHEVIGELMKKELLEYSEEGEYRSKVEYGVQIK
jgi:hypothetical protein